jgi:hypothetical protein
MTIAIVAPNGGYGNHLRWLMLLDPQFAFNFKIDIAAEEARYLEFQGADWPNFNDWKDLDPSQLELDIFNEIDSNFNINKLVSSANIAYSNTRVLSTVEDKIDFIKQYVYNQSRTWSNWLAYELKFRSQLGEHITFCHQYNIDQKITSIETDKIIIGSIYTNLSFKS